MYHRGGLRNYEYLNWWKKHSSIVNKLASEWPWGFVFAILAPAEKTRRSISRSLNCLIIYIMLNRIEHLLSLRKKSWATLLLRQNSSRYYRVRISINDISRSCWRKESVDRKKFLNALFLVPVTISEDQDNNDQENNNIPHVWMDQKRRLRVR